MVYIRIHEIAKKRSNKTYKKARETTSKKVGVKKKTCMIAIKCLQEAMLANGERCIDGRKRPNFDVLSEQFLMT